jgi:N-acetyl-gamma-glutamyl-phosphate reductase
MKKIRVGITGGAGYTGGELIRILLNHSHTDLVFVQSKSHAGQFLSAVHQDLAGDTDIQFSENLSSDIDLLYLCVGHGEARKFLENNPPAPGIRIIDLSQDFRIDSNNYISATGQQFVYGLPELNRDAIRTANYVANPGCFATTIELGLLPLAKQGLLTEVYTTGITGSTGAGQGLNATSHFSWRANNIQAYKTLTHQHLAEINQSLIQYQKTFGRDKLHFVPWRGDFTRGIFISSQLKINQELPVLVKLYKDFYSDHPFTMVSETPVFLKQVVNTNKCMIQLEKQGEMLVVHSVSDNLLKGASGQAVQNMNLMFGLNETEGLKFKAGYF